MTPASREETAVSFADIEAIGIEAVAGQLAVSQRSIRRWRKIGVPQGRWEAIRQLMAAAADRQATKPMPDEAKSDAPADLNGEPIRSVPERPSTPPDAAVPRPLGRRSREQRRPVRINGKTLAIIATAILSGLTLSFANGLGSFSAGREPDEHEPTVHQANDRPDASFFPEKIDYAALVKKAEQAEPAKQPARPAPNTIKAAPAIDEAEIAAFESPLFPTSSPKSAAGDLNAAGGEAALTSPAAENVENEGVYLQKSLQKPLSPFEIKAGTIIPAALITGLNSDLPGEIIGQVTENVFDTVSGQHLLLPQGTKIIGRYESQIGYAQSRLQVVWDRLIMPNGNSIQLEAMVGADKTGASGLEDEVDYHVGALVGAIILSSVITATANLATDSSAEDGFADDLGDAAAQEAAIVGAEVVRRQLDVQPTITVRPGFKLNILVNKDVRLEPYAG